MSGTTEFERLMLDLFRELKSAMGELRNEVKTEIREVKQEVHGLREEMERRFEQVDKRFEQVDKRFEQIDKRFEQIDKRFEQIDKRFELAENEQRWMREKMLDLWEHRKEVTVRFSRNWAWQNLLFSGGISLVTAVIVVLLFTAA